MDNVTGGSGDTVTIGGRARHVSSYLRDFLFPPERLHAPVSMLSGGERNRLLLARLFARPSNLLVMDEPTNDLDAETLDLLEEMVADYNGTLLLVSHDRAFIDNVVTSTLVFEGDGRINEYVGGYSDWLRQRRPIADPRHPRRPRAKAAAAAPPSRAAKPRKRSYKEQRELDAMPAAIQRLEDEQAALQAAVSDPELFRRSPAEASAAVATIATDCAGTRSRVCALGHARVPLALTARPAATAQQIARIRQRTARRIGNDQRGGLLAADLLQLAHGLLHRLLGGLAEFCDRRAQRGCLELEIDRHRTHRCHDLRLADEQGRPRNIGASVGGDRRQSTDCSDATIGEGLFAIDLGRVHGLLPGGHHWRGSCAVTFGNGVGVTLASFRHEVDSFAAGRSTAPALREP